MSSTAIDAHLAILNLEGEYARTWDTLDAEGWAALFTEDGVFETIAVGKLPGKQVRGRRALAGFCRELNQRFKGIHLIHTPSVQVDRERDRARSWIHFEFLSDVTNPVTAELNRAAGVYHTDYVRTPAGWRMQYRTEQVVTTNGRKFHGVPRKLGARPG